MPTASSYSIATFPVVPLSLFPFLWKCAICSYELCRANIAVGRRWILLGSSIISCAVAQVRFSCWALYCRCGWENAFSWLVRTYCGCPLLEGELGSANAYKSISCHLLVMHGSACKMLGQGLWWGTRRMKHAAPCLVVNTRCFREIFGSCAITHAAGKFLLYPRLVQLQEHDALNLFVML